MPFSNRISGDDLFLTVEETAEVWQNAIQQSVVLGRFRRTTMSKRQKRIPVMTAFPVAYWVSSGGLKQTTKQAWEGKMIEAEELATIVPISEDLLADADFDIWGEVRPRLSEAIARKLDSSVFFGGADVPATFPQAIVPAAIAAENAFNIGTHAAAAGGLAEDLNQTFALVEGDGYSVGGLLAETRFRANLRGARDTQGNRLMDISAGGTSVLEVPTSFVMPGLFPDPTVDGNSRAIAVDAQQFVIGVRQDIQVRLDQSGVISDDEGKVIYNLFQQDMVALRVTFRAGWQVPNPVTHEEDDPDKRYPAAVLRNAP